MSLLRVLIGSLRCLPLLLLARISATWVLLLQHSNGNFSTHIMMEFTSSEKPIEVGEAFADFKREVSNIHFIGLQSYFVT